VTDVHIQFTENSDLLDNSSSSVAEPELSDALSLSMETVVFDLTVPLSLTERAAGPSAILSVGTCVIFEKCTASGTDTMLASFLPVESSRTIIPKPQVQIFFDSTVTSSGSLFVKMNMIADSANFSFQLKQLQHWNEVMREVLMPPSDSSNESDESNEFLQVLITCPVIDLFLYGDEDIVHVDKRRIFRELVDHSVTTDAWTMQERNQSVSNGFGLHMHFQDTVSNISNGETFDLTAEKVSVAMFSDCPQLDLVPCYNERILFSIHSSSNDELINPPFVLKLMNCKLKSKQLELQNCTLSAADSTFPTISDDLTDFEITCDCTQIGKQIYSEIKYNFSYVL
jgi:hypothetical protein